LRWKADIGQGCHLYNIVQISHPLFRHGRVLILSRGLTISRSRTIFTGALSRTTLINFVYSLACHLPQENFPGKKCSLSYIISYREKCSVEREINNTFIITKTRRKNKDTIPALSIASRLARGNNGATHSRSEREIDKSTKDKSMRIFDESPDAYFTRCARKNDRHSSRYVINIVAGSFRTDRLRYSLIVVIRYYIFRYHSLVRTDVIRADFYDFSPYFSREFVCSLPVSIVSVDCNVSLTFYCTIISTILLSQS